MVLSYTGVAKKIKFKIFCTPHSTQYFVALLCHLLSTNNHLNPPFTNEDEKKKTIEITGRIPLTTQVQYTHIKSISCLEGSDAMRCKHIAKTVHLVTKCSLTFPFSYLFFQFTDFFFFFNNLSWFPSMYKSTMKPLNVHTWFAVDLYVASCHDVKQISLTRVSLVNSIYIPKLPKKSLPNGAGPEPNFEESTISFSHFHLLNDIAIGEDSL